MKRVTGIGGVFFRSPDPEALKRWYRSHLDIETLEGNGAHFLWRDQERPSRIGRTIWSPFPGDTDYFGPGDQSVMINYRVEDLDGLLEVLRKEGVEIVERRENYDYGRFAWIVDPDGNRVELWEPAGEG